MILYPCSCYARIALGCLVARGGPLIIFRWKNERSNVETQCVDSRLIDEMFCFASRAILYSVAWSFKNIWSLPILLVGTSQVDVDVLTYFEILIVYVSAALSLQSDHQDAHSSNGSDDG